MRIDRVFGGQGYTNTFGNAPLVFGAFPSLHSGCAVMEALFLSHFFPGFKPVYWCYTGILWWATMYLSHHYLIDLTGGACLSVMVFYVTMPAVFKDVDQIDWTAANVEYDALQPSTGTEGRDEEFEAEMQRLETEIPDEEQAVERKEPGLKGKRSVSWGETKVLGEDEGDMGVSRS